LTRRLGIPKTDGEIRCRVIVGGEMFEGPRQPKQSSAGKTQPDNVATDRVAALNWTSYLLR